jgi:hypothetical protein
MHLLDLGTAAIFMIAGLVILLVLLFHRKTGYIKWQQGRAGAGSSQRPGSPQLPGTAAAADSLEHSGLSGRIPELLIQPVKQQRPFLFRSARDTRSEPFHITEMVAEPAAYVNASNANTWLYRSSGGKMHFLVSGHANGPVCRDISSLLFNTYFEMVNVDHSLLVPGASYLEDDTSMSSFLGFTPVSPLMQLAGDLQPFTQYVGLANILQFDFNYREIQQQIHEHIRQAQTRGNHVLLKLDTPGDTSHALFLPFYKLAPGAQPLSFLLPLDIFETTDFTYLKEVHQQSLLLEMMGDALRRKQKYQEWLRRDEKDEREVGSFYQNMSQEEKKAKRVQISGHRDYLLAKEVKAAPDGKENFISWEEYYTQVLPGLLSEDKRWIEQMDELMKNIQSRDPQKDQRLDEQNIALLIDSFLRGWPSIFLGGSKEDEGQQRYTNWCRERRETAWRMIHRQMEGENISSNPLVEENTIFDVRMAGPRTLRITPLHLVTDKDLFVYLSPSFGVTYYVHGWSRRKLVRKPGDSHPDGSRDNHLDQALEHIARGAQWLDKSPAGADLDPDEIIRQAIAAFKLALETHPAAVQEIWNLWWARYSRETSGDFDRFKILVKALKAHTDCHFKQSAAFLEQFLNHYPDYLPDPYILLAIQETRIPEIMKARKTVTDRFRDLAREHDQKVEFLKSNLHLIEEFKARQDRLKVERSRSPYTDNVLLDQLIYPDQEFNEDKLQRLKDVSRFSDEIAKLKPQLETMKERIEHIDREMDEAWEVLKSTPNRYIDKARELAPLYVENIFKKKQYSISDFYILRFRDIHELLKGDEYIDIAYKLYEAAFDLGKKKITVFKLPALIDACFDVQYIDKEGLSSLDDFRIRIDRIKAGVEGDVSPIVREFVIKKEMERIATIYFQDGLNAYEEAYLLPEFNEPVIRLTQLYSQHHFQYRRALEYMFSREVALRNSAPHSVVKPLLTHIEEESINFKSFSFDMETENTGILSGQLKSGETLELARIENLTPEEALHIRQEVEHPRFRTRITIGNNAADKILNIMIAPSPCSQRWSRALQQLEPWLIRLIAYLALPPVPAKLDKKSDMVRKLEDQPIVEGVELDTRRIKHQFLEEIGVNPGEITFIEEEIRVDHAQTE